METDKFIFKLRDDILLIRLKITKTKDKYFLTYNFYTLGGLSGEKHQEEFDHLR